VIVGVRGSERDQNPEEQKRKEGWEANETYGGADGKEGKKTFLTERGRVGKESSGKLKRI